jgi:hypothetical protein
LWRSEINHENKKFGNKLRTYCSFNNNIILEKYLLILIEETATDYLHLSTSYIYFDDEMILIHQKPLTTMCPLFLLYGLDIL